MPRKGRRDCRKGARKKAIASVQREEVIKSIRKARKATAAGSTPANSAALASVVRGVGGSSHPGRVAATDAQLDGQFAEPSSTSATLSYLEKMRAEVGSFAAETRRKYDQSQSSKATESSKATAK
jgi:hypothetical protein